MPRFGGLATMLRLPAKETAEGLDVAFVGVPFDIGTSNRPGARLAPRQIRAESCLIRPYNMATRAAPFDSLQVADVGDVAINTFNLEASIDIIERFYRDLLAHGCRPLTLGGDHTIVLPILRSMRKKQGPLGVVHIDAHADVNEIMFREKIAHGTLFRRMVEEELVDRNRVVQIGLRATGYAADDFDWPRSQGFRVVQAEECWHKSLELLMAEVRGQMASGPVYMRVSSVFHGARGFFDLAQARRARARMAQTELVQAIRRPDGPKQRKDNLQGSPQADSRWAA
ncbi:MAG: arginase family protein [Planctomycetes bacterium]|nr:arginase family protein [Planctomycetota bacterium]